MERGAVAQELRDGLDPGKPRRSRHQPAAPAAARARGGRQCLSLRRPPVRLEGGPELEDLGRLDQRAEAIAERTLPCSRRSCRPMVGTEYDAVAAVQPRIRSCGRL